MTHCRTGPPPDQGLYHSSHEHDACGVGFVVDIKGQRSHAIVRQALEVLDQPAAPRRLRLRGQHGRRRGHPDPDARLVPAQGGAASDAAAGRARTAPGWSSCRARSHERERLQRLVGPIVAEEGQELLGWRDLPTDDRLVGASAVAVEPVFKQVFIGRGAGARRAPTRASASSASCTSSASASSTPSTRSTCRPTQEVLLRGEPLRQHAHLQGHAHRRPDRDDVPRSGGPRPGVGAGAGAPAVQHQHVPVLAAGASRTGTSRTTAKSTRCAATSTG